MLNLFKRKTEPTPIFSPLTRKQYNKFLEGYLRFGGEITHHYSYKFGIGRRFQDPQGSPQFVIANRDFDAPKRTGAASKVILVPEGINCRYERRITTIISSEQEFADILTGRSKPAKKVLGEPEIGHDTILFMDNFTILGSWIPAYEDTLGYNELKA